MKLLIFFACCVAIALVETTPTGLEYEEPDWAKQVRSSIDECRSPSNATEPKINYRFHHVKRHDYSGKYVEYVTCALKKLDLIGEDGETNVENVRKHLNEVLQDEVKRKVDHMIEHYKRNRSTEEKNALHLWHSLNRHWKKCIRYRYEDVDEDNDESEEEWNPYRSHRHRHH